MYKKLITAFLEAHRVTLRGLKSILFLCGLMTMSGALAGTTIKGPTPPQGLYTIQQQSTGRFINAFTTSNKDFSAYTDILKIIDEQMWYLKYISDFF